MDLLDVTYLASRQLAELAGWAAGAGSGERLHPVRDVEVDVSNCIERQGHWEAHNGATP